MRRRAGRKLGLAAAVVVSVLASGCAGVLKPESKQADRIANLWWLSFWLGVAVFVVVTGLLLYAGLHRRGSDEPESPEEEREHTRGWMTFIFIGGGVIPVIILGVVFGYSLYVLRLATPSDPQLVVDITAHDWYWTVSYPGVSKTFKNVVYLPVDQTTKFELRTADVIHSLWVPQLNGKTDLIPGRTNVTYMTPTKVGTYLGRDAEFSGVGFATNTIDFIVEPQQAFAQWLARQRA